MAIFLLNITPFLRKWTYNFDVWHCFHLSCSLNILCFSLVAFLWRYFFWANQKRGMLRFLYFSCALSFITRICCGVCKLTNRRGGETSRDCVYIFVIECNFESYGKETAKKMSWKFKNVTNVSFSPLNINYCMPL